MWWSTGFIIGTLTQLPRNRCFSNTCQKMRSVKVNMVKKRQRQDILRFCALSFPLLSGQQERPICLISCVLNTFKINISSMLRFFAHSKVTKRYFIILSSQTYCCKFGRCRLCSAPTFPSYYHHSHNAQWKKMPPNRSCHRLDHK